MKYGIREICDVVLKAKSNQKIGNKIFYKDEPVLYFDTLKTSTMEGAATTVYAQGGRGNSRLVAWEGERTVTFTMEDALISPTGFAILSGAGLVEADKNNTIKVHTTEVAEVSGFSENVEYETKDITQYARDRNFNCTIENAIGISITYKIAEAHSVVEDGYRLNNFFSDFDLAVGTLVDNDANGEEEAFQEVKLIQDGCFFSKYHQETYNTEGYIDKLIGYYIYKFPCNNLDLLPNFKFVSNNLDLSLFDEVNIVALYKKNVQKLAKIKLNKQPYGKFIKNNCIKAQPNQEFQVEPYSEFTITFRYKEEDGNEHGYAWIYNNDRPWNSRWNYFIYDGKVDKYCCKLISEEDNLYAYTVQTPFVEGEDFDFKYGIEIEANGLEIGDIYLNTNSLEFKNYYDPSHCYVILNQNNKMSEPYIPKQIINETLELDMTCDDLSNIKIGDRFLVDYYTEVASGAQQIEITPDKFGGNYYLEATTLFRNQDGTDVPAKFTIPNCKIQSNFNFTMASSGDPSTFTFTMDAFPDYLRFDKSKKVIAAIQLVSDNKIDSSTTRDRTKSKLKLK